MGDESLTTEKTGQKSSARTGDDAASKAGGKTPARPQNRPQVKPTPGKVGLKHVAQAAGVSISSVSMALADHPDMNEQTKLRIRQICRQMGYRRPRKSESAQESRKVVRFGFVLLGSQLQDDTHLGLFNALAAAAHTEGVRIEVRAIPDPTNEQNLIDDIFTFAAHLDGLILSGYVDAPLLSELGAARIPHIAFGHVMVDVASIEGSRCQLVTCDEVAMAMLATRRLLAVGHKRIAFVCERIPRGLWNERWLRGYHAAMIEHGMKLDPSLVQITGKVMGGAQPAIDNLMKLSIKPTAYICPDIRIGASLVQAMAAHQEKLTKRDLVISGHARLLAQYQMQDWPWIAYDLNTMAAVAIRQLQQMIRKPMPCSSELMIPFLTANLP